MEQLVKLFGDMPLVVKIILGSIMGAIMSGLGVWLYYAKTNAKVAKHGATTAEHNAQAAEQQTKVVTEQIKQKTALSGADYWESVLKEERKESAAKLARLETETEKAKEEARKNERELSQERMNHAAILAKMETIVSEVETLKKERNEALVKYQMLEVERFAAQKRSDKTIISVETDFTDKRLFPVVEHRLHSGELLIIGESLCPVYLADSFFRSIIALAQAWLFSNEMLTVVFDAPHANTVSKSYFQHLFDELNLIIIQEPNKNIVVEWHYYGDDAYEEGKEYAEFVKFDFQLKEKANNNLIQR